MKRLIISIFLAVALLVIPVSGALAATSQNVTVTATPAFVSIANTPTTWTVNGLTGNSVIEPNTQYYSNPLGDTSAPTSTVVDGECRFTVTNTSSVNIAIVINFPNHTGGDASTNSDLGTNGATTFGAYSYTSLTGFNTYASDKEIAKTTGSTALLTTATPGDNFLWGLAYLSQSDAWTSGTAMSSTVVVTATAA
ncbi:hypothetical protein ACFLX7_05380 [Chloroflexota bacterium]